MSVLEVAIAIAIVSAILLGSASAFLGAMRGTREARSTSRAGVYLASVMEDLAARPYADLLAMDGAQLYEQGTAARSDYLVDLSVFPAAVDLLQMRAIVRETRAIARSAGSPP
ncbi:MAG: hypothetical protein IPJ77_08805 [Planctomycetes bacterium]|nr:hypothetical protein [Planctomycetota bacterium]